MRHFGSLLLGLAVGAPSCLACGGCYGPTSHVEHVRHVKRIQPGAPNATYGPTRALEWGQVNFLHTVWSAPKVLERGRTREGYADEWGNYGADWGDVVSFTNHLKHQAGNMGVDLLLVDTGDLHDGNGLSDATTPDAEISMKIFERLTYDLLTIGNHELYLAEVAYQTFDGIAKLWGDKYLTSNVQILNPSTNKFEYIGKQYKYFTTQHGLRIMAFGILFDFTGNTNVTMVTKAKEMVTQGWFKQALNSTEPVDMFLLLGHNAVRSSMGGTFGIIHDAIRQAHPRTPIQVFGGHTHIRDFAVLDESSTALESGRYCETLGWVSMSGFSKSNSAWAGISPNPRGVPNPTRKATANSTSPFVYSRRYLDWNRGTFEFHAVGKQDDKEFDYNSGLTTTAEITKYRSQLNLAEVYGCTPKDYCMTCAPFDSPDSIFPLLSQALAEVVINETRKDIPRYLISNTGGIRFDMHKGPFTYDDFFIVSPFRDALLYIPEVPCSKAAALLDKLNKAGASQKRNVGSMRVERDICVDPIVAPIMARDEPGHDHAFGAVTRRQVADLVPGYTTSDDFGTDGDDTTHSRIPSYSIPDYFQGAAGFGAEGCTGTADVVFVDFIEKDVLAILGSDYSSSDVTYYISSNYTTQDYLPQFVKQSDMFQAGLPNCTIA
ncbi:hypothetical protein PG997_004362 [Apiospora hydei]|uniref:Putative 5'-nucleotidase C-terminal domain-containing protein n=1 Tax=Apiospora hydei TaxID=1337664 RepID=A0ABR1X1Y7_9PEZI